MSQGNYTSPCPRRHVKTQRVHDYRMRTIRGLELRGILYPKAMRVSGMREIQRLTHIEPVASRVVLGPCLRRDLNAFPRPSPSMNSRTMSMERSFSASQARWRSAYLTSCPTAGLLSIASARCAAALARWITSSGKLRNVCRLSSENTSSAPAASCCAPRESLRT